MTDAGCPTLHSTHKTRGLAPQTPEINENDENGRCHSRKRTVYLKHRFDSPEIGSCKHPPPPAMTIPPPEQPIDLSCPALLTHTRPHFMVACTTSPCTCCLRTPVEFATAPAFPIDPVLRNSVNTLKIVTSLILRSLDSSCPFFLSDNGSIWEQ